MGAVAAFAGGDADFTGAGRDIGAGREGGAGEPNFNEGVAGEVEAAVGDAIDADEWATATEPPVIVPFGVAMAAKAENCA